jgi:hypothetical protein
LRIRHCEGVFPEAIPLSCRLLSIEEEIASPPEEHWRLAMTGKRIFHEREIKKTTGGATPWIST